MINIEDIRKKLEELSNNKPELTKFFQKLGDERENEIMGQQKELLNLQRKKTFNSVLRIWQYDETKKDFIKRMAKKMDEMEKKNEEFSEALKNIIKEIK
tara:strand:- start:552 stop:848 length:297 start_codon:yes stop_codon:yes gene_type:complete